MPYTLFLVLLSLAGAKEDCVHLYLEARTYCLGTSQYEADPDEFWRYLPVAEDALGLDLLS